MGQGKKKSAFKKGMKRSMAVSLGVMMTGGYFANLVPVTAKADTTAAIFEDFESDARVGGQMGSVTLERSTNAFSGESALFVTGREQDWNSYSYDISTFHGKSINFNAQMRVDADNRNAIVCVKTTVAGEDQYTWINFSPLANGQYTEINCNYAVPADSTATILYFGTFDMVNGAQTVDSYYLDNVSIKETYFIKETFDDYTDTSSLKGGAFGGPTFTLVENGSPENKALEVSNRTSDYYGYVYDIAAFAGNKIKVTAKISSVGAKEDASNTFAATLKTGDGDSDYNRVGEVTTVGSAYATMESAEYDVPKDASTYLLYFEGPENVTFAIDDVEIAVSGDYVTNSQGESGTTPTSYADYSSYAILKDLYKDYFRLGVACETISNFSNDLSEIGNPVKEDLIKREFNSITFGNELKPAYNMGYASGNQREDYLPFVINPAAKEFLDWAKVNNMPLRGHTMVWHSQCSDEVFCKNYTPVKNGDVLDPCCFVDSETMKKRLESYIDTLMEYMYKNGYADLIYAWDVVNEAVEPGMNEYNLRDSYWYKTIGPDFVYWAFKYAREAENKYAKAYASLYGIDPSDEAALKSITPSLFYNDYNEFQESKCDAIIRMVSTDFAGHNMKAEGLIDGIGMQGHVSDNTSINTYINALRKYSAVVDEVQITELDVSQTTTGANAQYYQAKFYKNLFSALIDEVKNGSHLNSVTIWGLTDDNSWKKQDSPLIFNGDLSKKMAFDGIVGAADGTELPAPAYETPDFKDMDANFDAEDATAESEGFTPRGDGTLTIQSDVVYNGKAALLDSGRTASWNGASFDVSRFIGQTIEISAWVKTAASEVKLSADIDGVWPNIAAVDTSDGTWKQIKGVYKVPSDMTSLKLYFENNTTDDLYIDCVKVKLQGMSEDFEGAANIASSRGVGHVPSFAGVTDADSRTEGGHSFLVKRAEQDANMKFDVSKYIGHTVNVKAYVKTSDAKIRLGMDGETPIQLKEVDSNGDWTEVSATYYIPNTLTSAAMYIETDGNADFYVDDITMAMADFKEDCEGATNTLSTRWDGAGTLTIVEDGEAGNHVAVLTNRTENYFGTAFDVSPYLGMEVEISMDVKTDDDKIIMTGDINNVWPNYLTTTSNKGAYKTIHAVV
ncbi:MAG: endo-1,4-beta-xylanase, partial [Clostridiales bacterium]|nr:endo-1,4-beta-xylanase [Clostridiales bacterium]